MVDLGIALLRRDGGYIKAARLYQLRVDLREVNGVVSTNTLTASPACMPSIRARSAQASIFWTSGLLLTCRVANAPLDSSAAQSSRRKIFQ
jgi:hypothetical protein